MQKNPSSLNEIICTFNIREKVKICKEYDDKSAKFFAQDAEQLLLLGNFDTGPEFSLHMHHAYLNISLKMYEFYSTLTPTGRVRWLIFSFNSMQVHFDSDSSELFTSLRILSGNFCDITML